MFLYLVRYPRTTQAVSAGAPEDYQPQRELSLLMERSWSPGSKNVLQLDPARYVDSGFLSTLLTLSEIADII